MKRDADPPARRDEEAETYATPSLEEDFWYARKKPYPPPPPRPQRIPHPREVEAQRQRVYWRVDY